MPPRLRPLLLLLTLVPLGAAQAQDAGRTDYLRVPVDISLWRHVSLGHAIAGDTTRPIAHHLSLNLPVGEAARLEGVALGIFGSVYTEDVYGWQVSGVGNVAGGRVAGLQVAGVGNVAGARLHGIQIGALGNIAGEGGTGLQAGALGNIAGGQFAGLQVGGLGNIVGDSFRGVQVAALANIAGERVTGLQVAGLSNIAGEAGGVVQAAGLANIAGGTVRMLQIAPINIAERVTGLQVGLVNVAGTHQGVPIGLISRVGGVPVHMETWTDETTGLHVGVLSGSAVVTNRFGVSVRPLSAAAVRWGAYLGLGVQQPLGVHGTWGAEVVAHTLVAENFRAFGGGLFQARVPVSYELRPGLALFGGPSLSVWVSDVEDSGALAPFVLVEGEGRRSVRAWPGMFVGLRIQMTRP